MYQDTEKGYILRYICGCSRQTGLVQALIKIPASGRQLPAASPPSWGDEAPEDPSRIQDYIFQRFRNYARLFLSRIKDTPRERYDELSINHPEILERIPQHYIASYLGITPISLSRIKNRK